VKVPPKNLFKKSKGVPKKAEFYDDFRSVGKNAKNAFEERCKQNRQLKVNFSAITNNGFSFWRLTFFGEFFRVFSNGFLLSIKFCVFSYPFRFLSKIFFWVSLLYFFGNFRAKFDSYGLKH